MMTLNRPSQNHGQEVIRCTWKTTASSPYLEDNMAVTAAIELLTIILMRGGQIGPVETTRSLG